MNTTQNQLGYIFQIDLSDMVAGEDYWLQADGKKRNDIAAGQNVFSSTPTVRTNKYQQPRNEIKENQSEESQ